MSGFLLVAAALGAERLLERGDFVLDRSSLAVEITRVEIPEAVAEVLDDPADRLCRATASYTPGPPHRPGGEPTAGRVSFAPTGCHPAVAASVAQAVSRWTLQLRPSPVDQQDILVAWFRFPEAAGGTVEVGVSVVPGTEVIAIPEGIAVANMAHPTRRAPVLRGRPEAGTCEAVLKVDETGAPYNFEFGACSPEGISAVRAGLLDWRFSPAKWGDAPVRVRVPLTVRFDADGTAGIRLLPAADDDVRYLSDDPNVARAEVEALLPPVPDLPPGPPLLVVHHSYYAPVEVYSIVLPDPRPEVARCTVGLQVRSDRRTYVWTEDPCDAPVKDVARAAAAQWLLRPSDARAKDEVFARFRADLWWRVPGEPPVVVIDEREIASATPLPAGVVSFAPPEPIKRIAPKQAEGRAGTCVLDVAVDAGGHPRDVTPESCPEDLAGPATAAVKKWRWSPARMGGEKVEATTRVSVKFR